MSITRKINLLGIALLMGSMIYPTNSVSTGKYFKFDKILKSHANIVTRIVYSSDGNTLAFASNDATIKIYEIATGNLLKILEGHKNWVYSVAYRSDGLTLASCSADETIRLWDIKTGTCIQTFHISNVKSNAIFSPDGTICCVFDSQSVYVWDVAHYQDQKPDITFTAAEKDGWFVTVAFNSDGKRIVIVYICPDRYYLGIQVWDITKPKNYSLINTFECGGRERINSVAFSSDSKTIAFDSIVTPMYKNKTFKIVIFDIETLRCIHVIPCECQVRAISYSPDSKTLIFALDSGIITIWDTETGVSRQTFFAGENIDSIIYSPDGKTIAITSTKNGTVKIWKIPCVIQQYPEQHEKELEVTPKNMYKEESTFIVPPPPLTSTISVSTEQLVKEDIKIKPEIKLGKDIEKLDLFEHNLTKKVFLQIEADVLYLLEDGKISAMPKK
jgi:WD40 repeat protein